MDWHNLNFVHDIHAVDIRNHTYVVLTTMLDRLLSKLTKATFATANTEIVNTLIQYRSLAEGQDE